MCKVVCYYSVKLSIWASVHFDKNCEKLRSFDFKNLGLKHEIACLPGQDGYIGYALVVSRWENYCPVAEKLVRKARRHFCCCCHHNFMCRRGEAAKTTFNDDIINLFCFLSFCRLGFNRKIIYKFLCITFSPLS